MLVNNGSTVSRRKHRYYVGMAFAASTIVLWGFGPSYYLRALKQPAPVPNAQAVVLPISALIHVHAIAFTAWMFLFLGQSLLAATGRLHTHRRLGRAAAALAILMVVLGFLAGLQGARENWNPGGFLRDGLSFMVIGLFDLLLFSIFVAAGLYYRTRADLHKWLMLLGTIGLLWPAITRMQYVAPRPLLMFGVLGMMIVAAPARDLWTERRIHPVSLWGGLVILASFPLRRAIAMTDMWHNIAAWLIR